MSDTVLQLHHRPLPPEEILEFDAMSAGTFVAAPELIRWIHDTYLSESGPLYWEGHAHLQQARMCALWASAENIKGGKRIIGTAEMPARMRNGSKWTQARQRQQFREFFGVDEFDFLITIDAYYAAEADDASFAALIDHELCHCAQDVDEFGGPRFNGQTGEPVFTMRAHDVSEFVSVVERFGIRAAGEDAVKMVMAAAQRPTISDATLSRACGVCSARVA